MKKRLLKKMMKQWISTVMGMVNMEIEVRHQLTGINLCYEFIENRVLFDSRRIIDARKEMLSPVGLEAYVKTLALHELGHAMDREALLASLPRAIEMAHAKRITPYHERKSNLDLIRIDLEEHEMNYAFEETAWSNAEKLNRLYHVVGWEDFEQIKFDSLLSYTALYNRDLLIHHNLVAATSVQIA